MIFDGTDQIAPQRSFEQAEPNDLQLTNQANELRGRCRRTALAAGSAQRSMPRWMKPNWVAKKTMVSGRKLNTLKLAQVAAQVVP